MKKAQLKELLLTVKSATFITIHTRTEVRLKKAGKEEFGPVYKLQELNGCVCFEYDTGVQKRLIKEGKDPNNFIPGQSWHTPIAVNGTLTALSRHKDDEGSVYLRFMLLKELAPPKYINIQGNEIDQQSLAEYMYSRPGSYQNQGLDEPLVFLIFKLESITDIKINGKEYKISP